MTKVFISYSHDSDEHGERILDLSNQLRNNGIDCEIDQYDPAPEEGWPIWMLQKMQDANYVLLICTETYRKRFEQREEAGKGQGVIWEGMLMQNQIYRNSSRSAKFVPIILNADDVSHIPEAVFHYSRHDLSKPRALENLYWHLRGELGAAKPPIGKPHFQRTINSDDLPTVEGELFGRKEELALLDEALADSTVHIVQFVASGGTGKTKLIRQWLDDNRNKIEALIAWSFYSQGSGEDKQISATPFFMQALKSLDSDKSVSDFHTEEEKGEYIADLLREKRCLLVLDGLEPLQQAGRGMRGELKDRAIRKMLRCLVGDHSSLCIITTRLPVHELKGRRQVLQHDLQNLAPEDGVALLCSFKEPHQVYGRALDMLAAVEEYGCHALALHLLGNALATYLKGDIRRRDTLTELIGDYDDVERHAFKVMQSYERWLEGTPELKLLYLLGLFDHPVGQEVLEVLWGAEIPGLTEGVPQKEWLVAQRDLTQKYQMMSKHEGPGNLFDCHPLIREYFGLQLKESQSEVWRQAHTVLYEYHKGLPEKIWDKYLPETLEEMQPLFRAVEHGVKASNVQQAFDNIYYSRIKRADKHYLTKNLGAANEDLSLLANFFIEPWSSPQKSLPEDAKAALLQWTGLRLRGAGRLKEAVALLSSSFDGVAIQVAKSLLNVIELHTELGDLGKAEECAEKIKEQLDHDIENPVLTEIYLTTYAAIMLKSGNTRKAELYFKSAERNQKSIAKNHPYLYSLPGISYCEIFLEKKKANEALKRLNKIFQQSKESFLVMDMAFCSALLGKIYMKQNNLPKSHYWFKKSVGYSLKAGDLGTTAHCLLSRSVLDRKELNFKKVNSLLQDVFYIAEPSGMRLHLTDYHLEMARLILAVEAEPTQYPEATPDRDQRILPFADQEEPGILTLEGHIAEATKLIEETGYHRRDAELAELQKQVGTTT